MELGNIFSAADIALPPAVRAKAKKITVKIGLLVPTAILLIGIVWGVALSGLAVQENIHFGQTAAQWVEMLTAISDYSSKKHDKPVLDLEDIRNAITEAAIPANRNTDVLLLNSFGDFPARITMPAVNMARIETSLPVRGCRRLSLYLANSKMSGLLNIAGVEAAAGEGKAWKNIYAVAQKDSFDPSAAEQACGSTGAAMFAVLMNLK